MYTIGTNTVFVPLSPCFSTNQAINTVVLHYYCFPVTALRNNGLQELQIGRFPSYCRIKGTGIGPFGYWAQPFAAPIGGYGAFWENPWVVPGIGAACEYE